MPKDLMRKILTGNISVQGVLAVMVFMLLISACLISYLSVSLWDYDFWFHISSGRYILSERHLPDHDPFSYPLAMEENRNEFPEWERFLLRQYWGAQVILYKIFDFFGPKGIIIFRSLALALILSLVFWHLQRKNVGLYISVPLIYLVYRLSWRSTGERPVLFSFFLVGAVFAILDRQRMAATRIFYALPLIMMLWSNLHGGFIIGDIVILAFMAGTLINRMLGRNRQSARDFTIFLGVCGLALLFSFLNPNGWDSFVISFAQKYKVFLKGVQEWEPPFSFFTKKLRPLDYYYVVLIGMAGLLIFLRNRKLEVIHLLLLGGFLYMSLQSTRFVLFFGIIAAMIMGPEFDRIVKTLFARAVPPRFSGKLEAVLLLLVVCGTAIMLVREAAGSKISFSIASRYSVPVRAVDFIEKNGIKGNIFNDYGYGGYVTWRLFPQSKNFIDTRSLNYPVMLEYGWIQSAAEFDPSVAPSKSNTPLWKRLLKHYKINYMLLAPTDINGDVFPLVLNLLESDDWVPVYVDRVSLIFVRKSGENDELIARYRISSQDLYNMLIYKSAENALADTLNPRYLTTLGDTFYRLGRMDDALKAYRYALQRFPENDMIKWKLGQLEEELKAGKREDGKSLDK